jgi:choline dehydrogenase
VSNIKNRRDFIIESSQIGAGLFLSAQTMAFPRVQTFEQPDFIIVGSGAGGGPLAARLARRGFYVVLLEAGRDHKDPEKPHLADARQRIPAYQGISTEVDEWSWNYFVRHSGQSVEDKRRGFTFDDTKDSKFVKEKNGILYPRASALGGCTIHNALITMIANPDDWDDIGRHNGDSSWNRKDLGKLFNDRIKNKRYGAGLFSGNKKDSRKFFKGPEGKWLSLERPNPGLIAFDQNLRATTLQSINDSLWNGTKLLNDPNANPISGRKEGAHFTPTSTREGLRISPREWLLHTEKEMKGRLEIRTGHFVTNLLYSDRLVDGKHHVIGVEGLHRKDKSNLYKASPEYHESKKESARPFGLKAKREVILAGGAFNSPQLLMLSGIGPRDELNKHNIPIRVNLPGVGQNLQDRYEFGVVANFKNDTNSLANCTFKPEDDPCLDQYLETDNRSKHLYSSNGVIVSHIKKSKSAKKEGAADLFIFATPSDFRGYAPGWSTKATSKPNMLTWAVLKANTRNTKGYVKLKSKNPHDTPQINFMNFAEGKEADLDAMIEGIELAKNLNRNLKNTSSKILKEQVWPPKKNPDTNRAFSDGELRNFVMKESWGHHASCTCKMGPSPTNGDVVDSKFQVYGTKGLRIVDASVFPKIPGLFIAAPIYTIAEKAADEITKKYL